MKGGWLNKDIQKAAVIGTMLMTTPAPVSIAATVALFAEIALPAYPILTVGPAVGCPVRIVGQRLKGYTLGHYGRLRTPYGGALLRDHPELRRLGTASVVAKALAETLPCRPWAS